MSGELGRLLDQRLRHAMGSAVGDICTKRHTDIYNKDLALFAAEMQEHQLFHYIPHRQVTGLPNFVRPKNIKAPEKLGAHLRALSQDLDFWRRRARR